MPEKKKSVILICGSSGSGKTSMVEKICVHAANQGMLVGGISAPGTFKDGYRFSLDVVDLATGERSFLAQRYFPSDITFGPFGFSAEGLVFGKNAILKAIKDQIDVLVIDEIGPFELMNCGWASPLKQAALSAIDVLVITIRPEVVKDICSNFFSSREMILIPVKEEARILDCLFRVSLKK